MKLGNGNLSNATPITNLMKRANISSNTSPDSLPYAKNGVLEKQWSYKMDPQNRIAPSITQRRSRVSIVIRSIGCRVPGGVETLLRTSDSRSNAFDNTNISMTQTSFSNADIEENDYSYSAATNMLDSSQNKSLNSRVNKLGTRLLRVAKGTTNRIERVAKGTTDRIERGMTGMAIRADQGKRPDWACAGCYVTTCSSSNAKDIKWEHIGTTDSIAVSNNLNTTECNNQNEDMVFHVPIVLTDEIMNPNAPSNFEPVLQVQLLRRSGAGIFNNNKAGGVGKHYIAGTATFKLAEIMNTHSQSLSPLVISSYIQSPVPDIHNQGRIILTVLPDTQFPSPNTLGYCLTDPKPEHCHPFSLPFHPPLQQHYAHKIKEQYPSNTIQVGVERAIESTVVLPCATAVTKLLASAASISASHVLSSMERMQRDNSKQIDPTQVLNIGHADCTVAISGCWKFSSQHPEKMSLGPCTVEISLQKPKCIFEQKVGNAEVPVFSWKGTQSVYPNQQPVPIKQPPKISASNIPFPFYPKVDNAARRIGSLSFEIAFAPTSDLLLNDISTSTGTGLTNSAFQVLQGSFDLDPYLSLPPEQQGIRQSARIPLFDGNIQVGLLDIELTLRPPLHVPSDQKHIVPPDLGLVSRMGMKPISEGANVLDLCNIDTANESLDQTSVKRRQQLETMGDFLSLEWTRAHAAERAKQVSILTNRYQQYYHAIFNPQYNIDSNVPFNEFVLPNEKKEKPSPCRPSSAKKVDIMAGIPMNVHVQSIVMEKVAQAPSQQNQVTPFPDPLVYANVTCGACADHPAGYKYGGLRRLESKRVEVAERLKQSKTDLILAIHNYFRELESTNTSKSNSRRYVSTSNTYINDIRRKCISLEEELASLTWNCAVRRGNVLSQAIAIGLTSLLSSMSNLSHSSNKNEIYSKAELWNRHGYLICFEGLLSAAGKELGMIEDASVAIDMLNMVSVEFVSESNDSPIARENTGNKIPVFASEFIRWVSLEDGSSAGALFEQQKSTPLVLKVGLDANFYVSSLPPPVQNGALIKFYAVLFEMGVDIHQWGANTSANARSKIADAAAQAKNDTPSFSSTATELDDDDEEEVESMDQDNDILTALNMEGFRKLNLYANSVFPQPAAPSGFAVSGTTATVHPLLASLWDYIRSSAGKMQHGVIDAAAAAAANLSGGGIIFCKSGKDRTAMQVTLKQAQYLNSYYIRTLPHYDEQQHRSDVYGDATLMRVHGTRLAVCEKNVGQPKYAFNSLQVKFMPEMLKPPMSVLAGFLKGGQVFTDRKSVV